MTQPHNTYHSENVAGEDRAGDASSSSSRKGRTRKSASAFRTISEVAEDLGIQQHVLRFWETKFTQVKPLKRGGGRRYYRPEDVELLKTIQRLLYTEGYTIKGVQKLLRGQGKQQILAGELNRPAPEQSRDQDAVKAETLSEKQRSILRAMMGELKDLRDMIAVDDEDE